jgi:hypothetical protein
MVHSPFEEVLSLSFCNNIILLYVFYIYKCSWWESNRLLFNHLELQPVVTAGSRQWPGLKDPRISCIENTKLKRRRRERGKKEGIKGGKY